MYFTGDNCFQNKFVYQPSCNMLQLKKGKCIDYVTNWKSKRLYSSILSPLQTIFLHRVKLSEDEIRIQFDMDALVVEQNKYA